MLALSALARRELQPRRRFEPKNEVETVCQRPISSTSWWGRVTGGVCWRRGIASCDHARLEIAYSSARSVRVLTVKFEIAWSACLRLMDMHRARRSQQGRDAWGTEVSVAQLHATDLSGADHIIRHSCATTGMRGQSVIEFYLHRLPMLAAFAMTVACR